MKFSLNENEEKKLIALFDQHEKNLDYLIYLARVFNDRPILIDKKNYDFTNKSDFEIKKILFANLEKLYKFDNDYIKNSIIWDTQLLKSEDYLSNPYLATFKNVTFKKQGWTFANVKRPAYTLCPYQEEYPYGGNYALKMGIACFDNDYIYPSISLYDQEWMSLNQHEIRTMEVPISLARGKVLTLGLGLGYFAFMASNKEDVKEVHIVEMDVELIKLFNEYLLPLFPHKEKIHIHKADAYHFINSLNDNDYDYIFSDLWHDVSDGLPSYIKLKSVFSKFSKTICTYWIEESILSYLQLIIIGIMKDEYYRNENEYDELQIFIKNKLASYSLNNSADIDSLLSNQGLNNILFI